jgi:hypothetical protein
MTNPNLELADSTPHRSLRRGRRLRVIGGAAVGIAALMVLLGYWLGRSTVRGWRELAAAAADSLEVYDEPTRLPPGSRVTYQGFVVGHLTTLRRFPREQSLGGPLLLFDGNWEMGAIPDRVRADTSLIGIAIGDLGRGRPVTIDLLEQPPPSQQPRGLLRLRPFHGGYRVY